MARIYGMKHTYGIYLPTVAVEESNDGKILVTHLKTGMQIKVEPSKLERWAVTQLRSEFTTTKEEIK